VAAPLLALISVSLLATNPVSAQSSSAAQALALEQEGKLPEAEEAWRQVVERNPQDGAAFASLGLVLSRQQKYREAATAYRRSIALDPKLPGVQLNLGLAEFKQGNFRAAIGPLRAALASNSQNTQARTLLGLSYYGAGQFAAAVDDLQPLAQADSANIELHNVLAQSCLQAKKFSCAFEEFRLILQQKPDSPASHVLLGEALDGLGRTPEAIVEFQAAAKLAPQEPNVNFGLGYLHWKSHQYDDAQRDFENELAIDPRNAQALAYLGDIEMKRNDPEKALASLRKATELRGDLRIAYVDMGAILAEQKQYPDAVTSLQRAVKMDPSQPDAHFRLGRVYQAMGNKAAAQKEFAKVRELHQKADDVASQMPAATPAPAKP